MTTSVGAGLDLERLRAARDPDPGVRGHGAVSIPTRASNARCSSAREGRAEQAVDPRRPEGDVGRRRLVGFVSTAPGATSPPAHSSDQAGRPVRTESGEPELLALLEAQARLRPKRVAERCPPDADRVEDRGLDDDVGGGVADLGARRRP